MATVAPPGRERSLANRVIDAMLSAAGSAVESIERKRGRKLSGHLVFTVQIEEDELDGGYIAECVELPGCLAQGETEEEALENIIDVIPAFLEAKMQRHLKTQTFEFESFETTATKIGNGDGPKRPRRRAIEIPVT